MENTIKYEMAQNAKKCPFCGCSEIVFEQYEHASGKRWRIWCGGCAAGIDPGWTVQRVDVLEMWNKRTEA